jgi:hypothetical protein
MEKKIEIENENRLIVCHYKRFKKQLKTDPQICR